MQPVLEAVPELPQPDWSVLRDPQPDVYQSHKILDKRNQELTENLRCTQMILHA
jgi:hypothetical protein